MLIEETIHEPIEKQTIDPRAQLVILILINIIGMTNRSFKMEMVSMIILAMLLIWRGMWKKCLRYSIAYGIAWLMIATSILIPNPFTGLLAMIGVMGRKTVPVLMFASSIIASTKIGKLIAALQDIHFPKGITIALAVAIRFFPTLKEEGSVVINSMKMRGLNFNLKSIVTHPILVIENILVPIMIRMTIIADELAVASITRGIDSSRKRTSYYENRFTVIDGLLILLFITMAVMAFMEVI